MPFENISQDELPRVADYIISTMLKEECSVITLRGSLGAGKTTLARTLIGKLTGRQDVISPTFNLVQIYESKGHSIYTGQGGYGKGRRVWHYDLYRLRSEGELEELGLSEAFNDICIMEWPELAERYLPKRYISVSISFSKGEDLRNFDVDIRGC